jgi:hypothetical protein
MKKFILYVLTGLSFCLTACYKDNGNYTYKVPAAPVVANLDTVYRVNIGDTLTITPTVTIAESKPNLGYEWRISVPELLTANYYYTRVLKIPFVLQAMRYSAQLTVIDSTNGMKYVHPFIISGQTAFSVGTTILSQTATGSELSFALSDGTLKTGFYETINGESLPAGPLQVTALFNQYLNGGAYFCYWITTSQGADPGVKIDPNTFQKIATLKDNFFTPPASIVAGQVTNNGGAMLGVLNGQMYEGTTSTASTSPDYGKFGLPASGDYSLYSQAILTSVFPCFIGYDVNRKQIVGFTNYGAPSYIGTTYGITNTTAFDPRNIGIDPVWFAESDDQYAYLFGNGSDGKLYELGFSIGFGAQGPQITPNYKRVFSRPDLILPTTKWLASPLDVIYFSSGSTIYRYNPTSQDISALTTDLGGKTVSMLKLSADGFTMTAGVDGSLLYLDVSIGKTGTIIKRIDGIPGSPVDVNERQ